MKLILIVLIIFFLNNCSFDNKTGIWNSEQNAVKIKNNKFKDFKKLNTSQVIFNKIIPLKSGFQFETPSLVNTKEWREIFYNQNNNLENFQYEYLNQVLLRTKKITKYPINEHKLFTNNNLIISDEKGNLIIYSLKEERIINKFNFYKKQYKKIKKKLNFIIEDEIIYVSDNIGYFYAFDIKKRKLVWAKNYKVPFNSNMKISNKFIFSSNINNIFLTMDKINGNIIKRIPTEEALVQNNFKSNLAQNNEFIFYLNTFGSLYAIDQKNYNTKWYVNLNMSIKSNLEDLFSGKQIVNNDNFIVISSNKFTYILDATDGSIVYQLNIISKIKPLIMKNYLFILSNNDLLISFNMKTGEIIYSYDLNEKIAEFLKIKKKDAKFKFITLANNNLFIILKNSYALKFSLNGILSEVYKLPSTIRTNPIFIDKKIIFLNFKNKLVVVN